MANLLSTIRSTGTSSDPTISLEQWANYFNFNGLNYQLNQTMPATLVEEPDGSFVSLVQQAYKSNGVIFACMLARLSLFSEARFQFRVLRGGRPGELFGNESLIPLERPWRGGRTGDLLTRAIQDADLAGNAFFARRPGHRIRRMRPDWVTIILGSDTDPQMEPGDIDAEPIAYIYHPNGRNSGIEPEFLLPEQVAHWAPIPDPTASFRGMSWITPIIREVMGDSAATNHKLKFFEHGATPNLVVTLDKSILKEKFEEWVEKFKKNHEGLANAYKTLYLGAGATAEVVGSDLKEMDFKITQGAGETRIAAAAGVPPVIVGLSEGLQAATYSNYGQARRRFADGTMRPLWRSVAGALESIVPPPPGAELWYDDRDIPFLAEDAKDRAEMQGVESRTLRTLTDAGFTADSVKAAVIAQDWTLLEHSGLFSVQLQPPMPDGPTTPAAELGRSLAALVAPHLPRETGETPDVP